MCLTVDEKKFNAGIAQEDIVVYKVLIKGDNSAFSPYWAFEYKMGETYNIEKPLEIKKDINCNVYVVHEGFHSFLTLEDAKDSVKLFSGDCFERVFRCFRCIIPKGSNIVYGKFGTKDAIVSEEIKIIGEV